MSKNEKKTYKIRDCRKYYDRAAIAYLGFAGSWLVSLFTASNYDQFIALIAGFTCSVLKTKYELDMLHSYEVNRIKQIYIVLLIAKINQRQIPTTYIFTCVAGNFCEFYCKSERNVIQ